MEGVLNVSTNTVHRRRARTERNETECGATRFVDDDRLDTVEVERAVTEDSASKCGRCFTDGGGY